jgi:Virulence factor
MAKIKITYWKEIPVLVNVQHGNEKVNIELPSIYMETVDAIATHNDDTDAKSYVKYFHHDKYEEEGSVREIAESVLQTLQKKFSRKWLKEQWKSTG